MAWEQRYAELEAMVADACASNHFERSGEYQRFSRWEEATDRRFSQFQEATDRRFSQFQEATDRRFSQLEAMVAELRDWIDGDEEQLPVMDDETDLLMEDEAKIREGLVQKAISEEKLTSQFQVPMANSEIVRSIEPGKVDLELEKLELNENLEQEWVQKNISQRFEFEIDVERDQEVQSMEKICAAHQVLGKKSQHETLGIKKKTKGFKSGRFKFKHRKQQRDKLRSAHQLIHRGNVMYKYFGSSAKVALMKKNKLSITWPMLKDDCFIEDDQVSHETIPLRLLVRFKFWKFKFINRKLQKMMREHGYSSYLKLKSDVGEDDEMFTGAKAVGMRFLLRIMLGITESDASQEQQAVFEKIVMMNKWLQTSLVIEQVMRDKKAKFTKQWMFKFRKKKIDQWLDYNLIVAYLGNKKTWTKLRVREHDNLTWKEDASDESRSRSRMKIGDAMITCKNLLEKSYDKTMEIVAWGKSPGRFEISCAVDAFEEQESSKFRKFAVAFMDISTVAETQGFGFVHVLHKDAVLDSKLGYLMGNMMEEDQKQQGDSELLVIVLECVDAKGGVGMDKKPSHLSLRNNRVWDPGD